MKKASKKNPPDSAPVGHVRRFLAIVNAIRAGDFPNKRTLAEELKITTRTVQHYTVLLRELGAPLEFDTERNGFYFSKEWHL
jgi:predicted DNA-binding transcriptional regulator YafY